VNVEERVREALVARAGLITADRLQPAMPPTVATSRPPRGVRWVPMLAAAAAAVAILFTVILLVRPGADVPAGPATPAPVSPAPQRAETGPPVSPSRPAEVTPNAKAPQPGTSPGHPGPGTPALGTSPAGGSPAGGSKLSPAVPPAGR
jgi:hypothetical protein